MLVKLGKFVFLPLIFFSSLFQYSRAASGFDSEADPEAVVTSGRARFTVLTSRMIRIQYSSRELFEDRAIVDTSSIQRGLYMIRVNGASGVYCQKVMRQ